MHNRHEKICVGLVFDDTLDSNDGVAQQVKRLGEYLSSRGHKVFYMCGETKLNEYAGGKIYSLSKNMKIKFNGNRLSMPVFSNRRQIKNVLKINKPDIIHATAPYSPFLGQRIIAIADRMGIATVGSFHILPAGLLPAFGSVMLGMIQRFSLKRFQEFTSTSKSAARFAQKTMGIKSVVVPNMVDVAKFSVGLKQPKMKGCIVFLGRLVSRKGCKQLIRAFSVIAKANTSASLVIAGDGPERPRLESLVKNLNLAGRVKFLGYISEEEKPKILGGAGIACFPALSGESFGVVLIEAMASGAGVVLAGDNPGYRCVMEEMPVTLIDPNDTESFAARLIQLLDDAELRAKLHKWQLQNVGQYDFRIVGHSYETLYRKAIAKLEKNKDN